MSPTMGEKILTHICHPSIDPIPAFVSRMRSTFHTEKAVCITNIPIETHMILDRHFFTASSSDDEKRSLMMAMMRNMTAIAMKKFLILKAIWTKVFIIPGVPVLPGEKKNSCIGMMNSSSTELVLPLVPMSVLRTLISWIAQVGTDKKREKSAIRMRERNFIGENENGSTIGIPL